MVGVRPRTGRRTAPKLPVALAAASIAAFQRDESTAAAMKASVRVPKSPNAPAIGRRFANIGNELVRFTSSNAYRIMLVAFYRNTIVMGK
jgi:hypothetical protein